MSKRENRRLFGVNFETDDQKLYDLLGAVDTFYTTTKGDVALAEIRKHWPNLEAWAAACLREMNSRQLPVGKLVFEKGQMQAFPGEVFAHLEPGPKVP